MDDEPEDLHVKEGRWQFADGTVVRGFRVQDHGRRPLAPDTIQVSKKVRHQMLHDTEIDETTDAKDSSRTFQRLSNTRIGTGPEAKTLSQLAKAAEEAKEEAYLKKRGLGGKHI